MGHHAFYWYWLLWSDFRHLTGFDSAYVSTMLNLYALQYFVDHEINTEKKKKKKKNKNKKKKNVFWDILPIHMNMYMWIFSIL